MSENTMVWIVIIIALLVLFIVIPLIQGSMGGCYNFLYPGNNVSCIGIW